MLGDRVIYTRGEGDEYAAIVAKTRPDHASVKLVVFMPDASEIARGPHTRMVESKTWYSHWVPYHETGASNTWRWRPDGSR